MENLKNKSKVIETYGLLFIDIICAIMSYLAALYFRFDTVYRISNNIHLITLFCILIFYILYGSVTESGREFCTRGYYVELSNILKRSIVTAILWGCSLFLIQIANDYSRLVFGYFIITDIVLTFVFRIVFKKYMKFYYKNIQHKAKIMVISDCANISRILETILEKQDSFYDVTSAVVWDEKLMNTQIKGVSVVANSENIWDVTRQLPLDEVLIHLPHESRENVQKIIREFEIMGIVCHYSMDIADWNIKTRRLGEFAGFTVITYSLNEIDYKHKMIKRGMDIIGGIIGLCITALLFPIVAVAIKTESRGPILFVQERIGKNGRRFKMYKFRSMYLDAEERKKELMEKNEIKGLMFKMEDDPRVTRAGKILRKYSIDELPQFYNVLKGDMSLVGTRPPTVDEFEHYNSYYRRRLCMTPGLTGLWQVSGRSNIENFDDVVKYDLDYIDYWSLSLDIKIIIQTFGVIIRGRGAR